MAGGQMTVIGKTDSGNYLMEVSADYFDDVGQEIDVALGEMKSALDDLVQLSGQLLPLEAVRAQPAKRSPARKKKIAKKKSARRTKPASAGNDTGPTTAKLPRGAMREAVKDLVRAQGPLTLQQLIDQIEGTPVGEAASNLKKAIQNAVQWYDQLSRRDGKVYLAPERAGAEGNA